MDTHATPQRWTSIDSPVGEITLVGGAGFVSGLYFPDHRHRPPLQADAREDAAAFADVIAQLHEYFAGERTDFDVEVRAPGTPFQQRVWQALRSIPFGQTRTYGQLAGEIDSPGASRAVGLANGKNPVSIIVPCHRVVGASGKLTGYGGGLDVKRQLLELERQPSLLG